MNRLVLFVTLCAAAMPADACRCAQRTLADYFAAASEVVTGRLHATSAIEQEPPHLALQFELIAPAYKSQRSLAIGEQLTYVTAASSAACGIGAEVGAVYVLFAYESGRDDALQIDSCSGSRVLLPADGSSPEGFEDVPARFVAQKLTAQAGLSVLGVIAAAQPDPQDPHNDKLVGLLDVAGFSHAGHLLLLERPDPGAAAIAQLEGYEGLATLEVGYESLAAIVYSTSGGWYRLRTTAGDYGWLPPEYAGTYFPYSELPVRRLAYLPLPWHGFVWPSPGAGNPLRVTAPVGQREHAVEILESQSIGGSLWFRVNLLPRSPCDGGNTEKGTGGWVPGYREDGTPLAWFYSRGC